VQAVVAHSVPLSDDRGVEREGEDTDRLERAKVDEVEKLVDRGGGRKVADIDGAPGIVRGGESHSKRCA